MTEQMKHGSETFFIEGEGVLTTQVGGRTGDEGDPVSESENPRPGQAARRWPGPRPRRSASPGWDRRATR